MIEPLDYASPTTHRYVSPVPWLIFAAGLVPAIGCCGLASYDITLGDPPGRGAFWAYHYVAGLNILLSLAWLAALGVLVFRRLLPWWTLLYAVLWIGGIVWANYVFIEDTRRHPAGQYYMRQG